MRARRSDKGKARGSKATKGRPVSEALAEQADREALEEVEDRIRAYLEASTDKREHETQIVRDIAGDDVEQGNAIRLALVMMAGRGALVAVGKVYTLADVDEAPPVWRIWTGKGLAHRAPRSGQVTPCGLIAPNWPTAPTSAKPCGLCDQRHEEEAARLRAMATRGDAVVSAAEASPFAHRWDVVCPTCDAQIGEGCITKSGAPQGVHAARVRLADKSKADTVDAVPVDGCGWEQKTGRSCPGPGAVPVPEAELPIASTSEAFPAPATVRLEREVYAVTVRRPCTKCGAKTGKGCVALRGKLGTQWVHRERAEAGPAAAPVDAVPAGELGAAVRAFVDWQADAPPPPPAPTETPRLSRAVAAAADFEGEDAGRVVMFCVECGLRGNWHGKAKAIEDRWHKVYTEKKGERIRVWICGECWEPLQPPVPGPPVYVLRPKLLERALVKPLDVAPLLERLDQVDPPRGEALALAVVEQTQGKPAGWWWRRWGTRRRVEIDRARLVAEKPNQWRIKPGGRDHNVAVRLPAVLLEALEVEAARLAPRRPGGKCSPGILLRELGEDWRKARRREKGAEPSPDVARDASPEPAADATPGALVLELTAEERAELLKLAHLRGVDEAGLVSCWVAAASSGVLVQREAGEAPPAVEPLRAALELVIAADDGLERTKPEDAAKLADEASALLRAVVAYGNRRDGRALNPKTFAAWSPVRRVLKLSGADDAGLGLPSELPGEARRLAGFASQVAHHSPRIFGAVALAEAAATVEGMLDGVAPAGHDMTDAIDDAVMAGDLAGLEEAAREVEEALRVVRRCTSKTSKGDEEPASRPRVVEPAPAPADVEAPRAKGKKQPPEPPVVRVWRELRGQRLTVAEVVARTGLELTEVARCVGLLFVSGRCTKFRDAGTDPERRVTVAGHANGWPPTADDLAAWARIEPEHFVHVLRSEQFLPSEAPRALEVAG